MRAASSARTLRNRLGSFGTEGRLWAALIYLLLNTIVLVASFRTWDIDEPSLGSPFALSPVWLLASYLVGLTTRTWIAGLLPLLSCGAAFVFGASGAYLEEAWAFNLLFIALVEIAVAVGAGVQGARAYRRDRSS